LRDSLTHLSPPGRGRFAKQIAAVAIAHQANLVF
jgi:hypothetical protein